MKERSPIGISLEGLGKALSNKRLKVPKYQRSYAWQEKHVRDLLTDIDNAIGADETEYFLGSIVTTGIQKPRPEVADGQQRIATVTILLAAIRDYFLAAKDSERAHEIDTEFLLSKDLRTLEADPRLEMNSEDNDYFRKRILSQPESGDRKVEPTKESHKRINQAAQMVAQHLQKAVKSKDATDVLARLVEFISDSLKVIWVEVEDDSNAFKIFETLNDRGLALAITDLLKNYLFGLADTRIGEVQDRWITTVGTIEAIDTDKPEELLLAFIRHHWSSRYGLTRERELYSEIKKRVKTRAQSIQLANELAAGARTYAALLNPSHDLWTKYGVTTQQHVETLILSRMVQIRPLLLAVLREFSTEEARKAIRHMVSWVVRFLIHGGLGGGTLETHYSDRAKEVNDGKITTAAELAAAMRGVVPSDSEFKTSFATASVSKAYLARYYLRVLEKQERGQSEPELVPNDNADVVILEHILPQNPSAAWGKISSDDQEAYGNRLGNLILLRKRIGEEIGNKGFAAKKKHYADSEFLITKELATVSDWGIAEIAERQARLAEQAVKAWPVK